LPRQLKQTKKPKELSSFVPLRGTSADFAPSKEEKIPRLWWGASFLI